MVARATPLPPVRLPAVARLFCLSIVAIAGHDAAWAQRQVDICPYFVFGGDARSYAGSVDENSITFPVIGEARVRATETGTGMEVRAGISYADAGVTVEGSVRGLAAHEASGYEDWGASGSVRIDPGTGELGLSLSLSPTVGAAASETERPWWAADARALAPGAKFEATPRLDAEVGYGFGAPHGLGVVTPYASLGLAEGAERAWRAGARWVVAPDVTLGLEGTHSESAGTAPERGVMLHGALRW